jgi:integrase
MVTLALLTDARIGELLALRWEDITDDDVTFMETKNGQMRRFPMAAALKAVLDAITHTRSEWVFANPRTHDRYTVNGIAHVFKRAVERAGIATGGVTLHTLRHTAMSRMIASGFDDYSVMENLRTLPDAHVGGTRTRQRSGRSVRSKLSRRRWAESGPNPKLRGGKGVVDGRRLELPTSALRTRRSPN